MYGAGRLERGNIVEYEIAAKLAAECGHPEMIDCLLEMAEVEMGARALLPRDHRRSLDAALVSAVGCPAAEGIDSRREHAACCVLRRAP